MIIRIFSDEYRSCSFSLCNLIQRWRILKWYSIFKHSQFGPIFKTVNFTVQINLFTPRKLQSLQIAITGVRWLGVCRQISEDIGRTPRASLTAAGSSYSCQWRQNWRQYWSVHVVKQPPAPCDLTVCITIFQSSNCTTKGKKERKKLDDRNRRFLEPYMRPTAHVSWENQFQTPCSKVIPVK